MKYLITEEQSEDISKLLIKVIYKEGPVTAAKLVSGYDNLKKLLGDYIIPNDIKITTIQEFIEHHTDGGGGIGFGELNIEPISYKENNDGYHQIEYLGASRAIINIYSGYKNETDEGEYAVYYEELPDKSLEDIFEMIINHLT